MFSENKTMFSELRNEKTLNRPIKEGDDVLIEKDYITIQTKFPFRMTYNGTVQKINDDKTSLEILRLSRPPLCILKGEWKETESNVKNNNIVNNLGKSGNSEFLEEIPRKNSLAQIFMLREIKENNGILDYYERPYGYLVSDFNDENINSFKNSIIYANTRENNDHNNVFLRKDFEIWNMDYRQNENTSERTTIIQLEYGENILFKYNNEILVGIVLYKHFYKNQKTNFYYTVVSPFIVEGLLLPNKIKLYYINPNQVLTLSGNSEHPELEIPKLISPKKIYSLQNFLNKNLYSENNEKIKIYLNTRFHVFTSNYRKPTFPDNYDIKIFAIYKSILCFKFLRFVYHILKSQYHDEDHTKESLQQNQYDFSIEKDTIDVYNTEIGRAHV